MTPEPLPMPVSDTGYYIIPQSACFYIPFTVYNNAWVKITLAHTNFYQNQTQSIRGWASATPQGISLTNLPDAFQSRIVPAKSGLSVAFYDLFQTGNMDNTLLWSRGVKPGSYFWNVLNMENKQNGFYLKIENLAYT